MGHTRWHSTTLKRSPCNNFALILLKCACAQDEADKLGVDISRCAIEDPATSQRLGQYVDLLCEARKHKVGTAPGPAAQGLRNGPAASKQQQLCAVALTCILTSWPWRLLTARALQHQSGHDSDDGMQGTTPEMARDMLEVRSLPCSDVAASC